MDFQVPEKISNRQRYTDRLGGSIDDKFRVLDFIPENSERVLDVGCADGQLTLAMAMEMPDTDFVGIDLDREFIEDARSRTYTGKLGPGGKRQVAVPNAYFQQTYLRDMLQGKERFEAITFVSVLHEFYSYGEGISSVIKALADAHELLKPGGVIVIRDMALPRYLRKVSAREQQNGIFEYFNHIEEMDRLEGTLHHEESYWRWASFMSRGEDYGVPSTLMDVNHYLLKSLYEDNWKHEIHEDYTAVTREDYEQIFNLLGMTVTFEETYLLPYLATRWQERFGLTDREIAPLKSTTLMAATKGVPRG